MAKDDVPVIHTLSLSMLGAEILLAIVDEYNDEKNVDCKSLILEIEQLEAMFDHVIAENILSCLQEYNVETNLKGIVSGVREISKQIEKIKPKEMVEVDFTRCLEAL